MTPAGFEDIIKDAWETLEGHGFPPEACSYLPAAIDNAITALTGARDDLLAEVIQLRAQVEAASARVDRLKAALITSDDFIREVANEYNMESAEGRRISLALAKIIRENDAALKHSSTMREADQ